MLAFVSKLNREELIAFIDFLREHPVLIFMVGLLEERKKSESTRR